MTNPSQDQPVETATPSTEGVSTDKKHATDKTITSTVTRRRFLTGLAASGAVGAGTLWAVSRKKGFISDNTQSLKNTPNITVNESQQRLAPPTTLSKNDIRKDKGLLVPGDLDRRILVLIELQGGNDGLSTIVPYTSSTYYDNRPNLAIPEDEVLVIDNEIGLNPALSKLHTRQLAIIEGIGHVQGNQSHFDMEIRWEQGNLTGDSGIRTGFLGRFADELSNKNPDAPLLGLSVSGHTPRFHGTNAPVLSFSDTNQLRVVDSKEPYHTKYRSALLDYTGGPMATKMRQSRFDIFSLSTSLPGEDFKFDAKAHPIEGSKRLVQQLAMANEFIKADIGVQVINAKLSGFDTHTNHKYKHNVLLQEVDYAIDTFLTQMKEIGREQDVLVAVTSEFGRRVSENGSGFDHGAGSTLFAVGPVFPGRHGQTASLTELANGNLKTEVPFDSMLADLAQNWLGVEKGAVLPSDPELINFV